MSVKTTFRAILLAGVCLAPVAAAAEDSFDDLAPAAPKKADAPVYNNEVDLGFKYQTAPSAWYGRYNGSPDRGLYGTLGFRFSDRDAWDSGNTAYWKAFGRELNANGSFYAPEASMGFRAGQQGSWGLKLDYDAITTINSTTFNTIYNDNGTLASGLVPNSLSNTTANSLGGYMRQTTAGVRRDIAGITGTWNLIPELAITTGMKHEHKGGTLEQSMLFGSGKTFSTGNPAAAFASALVYFPQPVDYDMDRYEGKLAYTTRDLQAQVSYVFNKFTDNNRIFSAYSPWSGTAGILNNGGAAIYALPPSNLSHQVSSSIGYNLGKSTRLTGNFTYGWDIQDNPLLNASFVSAAQALQAYNGDSTSMRAQNVFANIGFTTRPTKAIDYTVGITYDERDDKTGTRFFRAPENDTTSTFSGYIPRLNWEKTKVKSEFGYRILPDTRISLNYEYLRVDHRTANTVPQNETNTAEIKITSALPLDTHGSIGYTHTERTAQFQYRAYRQQANPGFSYEDKAKFYTAPYVEDAGKVNFDFDPVEKVNVSLSGKGGTTMYTESLAGERVGTLGMFNIDVSYTPVTDLSLGAFYTWEYNGRKVSMPFATAVDWVTGYVQPINSISSVETRDTTHTFGLTGKYKVTDQLKMGFDYNISASKIQYSYKNGNMVSTNAHEGEPEVNATMQMLSLNGEYEFIPGMSLWSGYTYQRLDYTDFQLDPYTATTFANAALPGDNSLSYSNHIIGTQLRVKW